MNKRKKIVRLSTIGLTLNVLLKGQLSYLNQFYEVIAVSSKDDNLEQVGKREKVRIIGVNMARDINLLKDVRSLLKLYHIFRKEKPAIVHSNTPKSSLLGMSAAYFSGIPHRIYTVTGVRYETERGMKRLILKLMEMATAFFASRIVPEGPGVKEFLQVEKITNKPLIVIGAGSMCGVDLKKFSKTSILIDKLNQVKKEIEYETGKTYLLAVGRLVKDKGIEELVEVFVDINRIFDHTRLILLGPFERELDPLEKDIEQLIEQHQAITHIHWSDDVEYFMSIADLLVHASHREGFPNVLLQAGAMACPVVCSNIRGNTDIITDKKTGLLFKVGDVEDLKQKLHYALKNNGELEKMAAVLEREIKNKYASTLVQNQLHQFYNSILNGKA